MNSSLKNKENRFMTGTNFDYYSKAALTVCQGCHAVKPVTMVSYKKHTGLIVVGQTSTHKGILCAECNKRLFSSSLIHCLLAGWWGIISFFVYNPIAIIGNIVTYFNAKKRFKKYSETGQTAADN
jgi:hypothetical protein